MAEIQTDSMTPNDNGQDGPTLPVSNSTPTDRDPNVAPKRRGRPKGSKNAGKAKKAKAPTELTEEQYERLGRLTFEAMQQNMTLEELIEESREIVKLYDSIFG